MKKIFFMCIIVLTSVQAIAQNTIDNAAGTVGQLSKDAKIEPMKIVFQLSTSDTLAHKALMKQLGNITSVEPTTQIEVVCHGPGLDMLRADKSIVASKINEHTQNGIRFYACEFSMKERKVSTDQILPTAMYVKAGIIYIVTKQQEGWSYIKSGF
ncbi:MAG: DsrE family protein [Bacteroidetes bacterium]|nr:DsrE family protein [Bacteroidota bacterium]